MVYGLTSLGEHSVTFTTAGEYSQLLVKVLSKTGSHIKDIKAKSLSSSIDCGDKLLRMCYNISEYCIRVLINKTVIRLTLDCSCETGPLSASVEIRRAAIEMRMIGWSRPYCMGLSLQNRLRQI